MAAVERRSRGSGHTRRAYAHDWGEFFNWAGVEPGEVCGELVQGWVGQLYASGNGDATVNRKLAALTSFYDFVSFRLQGEGLWSQANPFRAVERVRVDPYGRAVFPEPREVVAILRAIAGDGELPAVLRWRHLATIGGLYLTTRRAAEWLGLRAGDVRDAEGRPWMEYRYKGGKTKRQAIPGTVWGWVLGYLAADGRPWPRPAGECVFRAHGGVDGVDEGGRGWTRTDTGGTQTNTDGGGRGLSARRVNDVLKRYGARVGLDVRVCHAHGLRHAGALARLDEGASVMEIRDVLGHGSVAVTQIYIDRVLSHPADPVGDRLGRELGLEMR